MKKSYIALLVLFSIIIGAVAGYQYGKMRWQSYMQFWIGSIADSGITFQEIRSGKAYLSSSPETAIWALNQLLYTCEHYQPYLENDLRNDPKSMAIRKAITHGRLALVYKSIGDTNQYRENMDQALNLFDGSSEEYILKVIDILDRKQKEEMGQQAGAGYPPQGVGSPDP